VGEQEPEAGGLGDKKRTLLCFKVSELYSRGLKFFKLKGNQAENDRNWQKKCYYDPKLFFVKNINLIIKERRTLC
jgi:hypothetical protein